MVDQYPVDFTTDVGRVRKYIPDLRQIDGEFILTDDEIQSFIDDQTILLGFLDVAPFAILRAAAYAQIAIGNDNNLILKKLLTEDIQTDGPAVAAALLKSAQELLKRADGIEENTLYEEIFISIPSPYYPEPGRIYWRL